MPYTAMQRGTMNLARQLDAFRAGLLARLPPGDRKIVTDVASDLRCGQTGEFWPKAGDHAPDFALPDQHGRLVRLSEQLGYGPVVIVFVRGGWCPFCTLTLRAYQAVLPQIHELGAEMIAITPQPASRCTNMAERDLLAYSTLSDAGNAVADRYGVAYDLPEALRPFYLRLGHDLPRLNGTGDWRVPLPATFIVGIDGKVTTASVEREIHRWLEPSAVVRTLESLKVGA